MKNFNPEEYKTPEIKFKSEEEKNKFVITLVVLLLLVVLVAFFIDKKNNVEQAQGDRHNFKIQDPEVQAELLVVLEKFGTIESIEDFGTKTYYLQFTFAVSEQKRCLMGLKRVRDLYNANFKPEALFEYATVVHTHLNNQLRPLLKPGYKPKFKAAINIAYNKKMITQEQRDFLHELRRYRNIKGHVAGVSFKNEITDMFLNPQINTIDQLFLC
jgi:hypothetical protein